MVEAVSKKGALDAGLIWRWGNKVPRSQAALWAYLEHLLKNCVSVWKECTFPQILIFPGELSWRKASQANRQACPWLNAHTSPSPVDGHLGLFPCRTSPRTKLQSNSDHPTWTNAFISLLGHREVSGELFHSHRSVWESQAALSAF